jgi:hypothetical protein
MTNRPVIADPMVVHAPESADDAVVSQTVNRTVRVIKPMTLQGTDDKPTSTETDTNTDVSEQTVPSVVPEQVAGSNPVSLDQVPPTTDEPMSRDNEAEAEHAKTQLAEAEVARQQELDTLIVSGKYVVPIGAVSRRRSRMYIMVLCVIGLLLAALLFDVILDAGIVKLSKNIPHTHFFTTN